MVMVSGKECSRPREMVNGGCPKVKFKELFKRPTAYSSPHSHTFVAANVRRSHHRPDRATDRNATRAPLVHLLPLFRPGP
jgi:hypothetical protein